MVKSIHYILFLLLISTTHSYSQNESNIWHFGQFGGLNFNEDTVQVLLSGQMITQEGCSAISDNTGQLLFYTNGVSVWDRNHGVMPNGTGLMGHESTTQSSLILKKPLSDSIYYIFTQDAQAYWDGFRYSEVDMSLNNGLGDVTNNKNIPILYPAGEQLTAVRHCNNRDYWIIVHKFNSNIFHSYLLSSNGLNFTSVETSIGITPEGTIPYTNESQGYMKSSPDGKKIVFVSVMSDTVQIMDFDRYNGTLSNCIYLNVDMPYGVEFSPNSQILYITAQGPDRIFQYDLSLGTQNAIATSQYPVATINGGLGALQRGVDNKIYVCKYYQSVLGVIENPDSYDVQCAYTPNGPNLAYTQTILGLPNFPNRYIIKERIFFEDSICQGESNTFTYEISETPDSIQWVVESTYSSSDTLVYAFNDPGVRSVSLVTYYDCYIDTVTVDIYVKPKPVIDLGDDKTLCQHVPITLEVNYPNANYTWQDGSTESQMVTSGFGVYSVESELLGCTYKDSIEVINCEETIVSMPNVFSPNGDGINDLFIPINTEGVYDEELTITNRWGQVVSITDDIELGWNGASHGKPCLPGTYYWKMLYKDKSGNAKLASGFFQLVR